MALFANIVLKDGATTPVSHTFAVKSNDGRVSVFEDRVSGVPLGFGKLIVRTTDTSEQRTVKVDVLIPVLEAVAGANVEGFTPPARMAFQNIGKFEMRTNMRSTTQQRKDLLAFMKDAINLALINALVVDSEEISG